MQSYFVGTTTGNPTAGSNRYYALDGVSGSPASVETQASQVCPDSRTVDKWHIDVATAPGTSKTLQFTLMVNGVASALVVSIAGSSTSGVDDTHSVSLSAGDRVSVLCTLTSGGTNPSGITWTMRQTGTGQAVLFGGSTTGITASTFYGASGTFQSTTEAQVYAPIPLAGTVGNLYVVSDADPSPGNWVITLRASGDTTSTCTIGAGSTTAHDTTHTPAVTAGNRLSVHVVGASSPASSRISGGFVIVPTTDGDACILSSNQNQPSTAATRYMNAHGNTTAAQTSAEAVAAPQAYMQACTVKAIYLQSSAGTGAAKSWTATVRLNGATDTAAAVTITNASSGNLTGQSVAVVDNDLLDIKIVPTSGPASGNISTGVLYTAASDATEISPVGSGTAASVAPGPAITIPGFGSGISTASIVAPTPAFTLAPAYALATASAPAPTLSSNNAVTPPAIATASAVAPTVVSVLNYTAVTPPAIATAGVSSYLTAITPAASAAASSVAPASPITVPVGAATSTAAPVAPTPKLTITVGAATSTAASTSPTIGGGSSTLVDLSYAENSGGGLLLAIAVFPGGIGATSQATASRTPPLPTILAAPSAMAATASRATPAVNNVPAGITAAVSTAAVTASTPVVLVASTVMAAAAASVSPSLSSTSSVSIATAAMSATADAPTPAQSVTGAPASAIATASSATPADTASSAPVSTVGASTASAAAPLPILLAAPAASAATAAPTAGTPAVTMAPGAASATAAPVAANVTATNGTVALPPAGISLAAPAAPVPAITAPPAAATATASTTAPGVFASDAVVVLPGADTATASAIAPLVLITAAPAAAAATSATSVPVPVLACAAVVATSLASSTAPNSGGDYLAVIVFNPAVADVTAPLFMVVGTPAAMEAIADGTDPTLFYSGPDFIHTRHTRTGGRSGKTHATGGSGKTYARS